MAILLRDTNVVYRPGSKIPIRQSREKVLSASRNSHPIQFKYIILYLLQLFKVTFIYRKFINSYTDKFIILERDIYIYV